MTVSYVDLNTSIETLRTSVSTLKERHIQDLQLLRDARKKIEDSLPPGEIKENAYKLIQIDSEISRIQTQMAFMRTEYENILEDAVELQNNGSSVTQDDVNSWQETIKHLTALADAPDDTNAIYALQTHATTKLSALKEANTRLGREKEKFWGKALLIAGISLAIVGAIALTVALAIATCGASLAVKTALVGVGAAGLGFGGMKALFGGLLYGVRSPEYNELNKENTPTNVKAAAATNSEGKPMKKIMEKSKAIANSAKVSRDGLLSVRGGKGAESSSSAEAKHLGLGGSSNH